MARADYPADAAGATSVIMVDMLLFALAVASILREIWVIFEYRRYA